MNVRRLLLVILPLEPLHFGYGVQRGNILPTLPHIPGRAVRGALANWAIRNGFIGENDSNFLDIFGSSGNRCISYPVCYRNGWAPAPLSLFEIKGGCLDPRAYLVKSQAHRLVWKGSIQDLATRLETQGANKRDYVVDFLRRSDDWPAMVGDAALKPCRGAVQLDRFTARYNPFVGESFQPLVSLRAPHNDKTDRVGSGTDRGLFGEELLPRANRQPTLSKSLENYYLGELRYEDKPELNSIFDPIPRRNARDTISMCNALESPQPGELVFLGRRRVPAVIAAVKWDDGNTQQPTREFQDVCAQFTITFTSDLQLDNGDPYPVDDDVIKQILGFEAKKIRTFCAPGWSYGYDTNGTKKGPLDAQPVLRAGSCVLVDSSNVYKDKLYERYLLGAGADTRNGMGRFLVNAPVHDIEVAPHA